LFKSACLIILSRGICCCTENYTAIAIKYDIGSLIEYAVSGEKVTGCEIVPELG
jgi:hypothetical protein